MFSCDVPVADPELTGHMQDIFIKEELPRELEKELGKSTGKGEEVKQE